MEGGREGEEGNKGGVLQYADGEDIPLAVCSAGVARLAVS